MVNRATVAETSSSREPAARETAHLTSPEGDGKRGSPRQSRRKRLLRHNGPLRELPTHRPRRPVEAPVRRRSWVRSRVRPGRPPDPRRDHRVPRSRRAAPCMPAGRCRGGFSPRSPPWIPPANGCNTSQGQTSHPISLIFTAAAEPPSQAVFPHRRSNPLPLVSGLVKQFAIFQVSNTVRVIAGGCGLGKTAENWAPAVITPSSSRVPAC